jgi:streptomycin 6-kinase
LTAEIYLTPEFTQRIGEVFHERGRAWLARLPQLIADCEQRWSIKVFPPFALSYNYVAPALRNDGVQVVLKLGVLNPELLTEIAALRLFARHGIVQLLDADPEWGVLLLERLVPGKPLADLGDDIKATSIAAGVMRQLWCPVPADHSFPTVARWASGLQKLRPYFGGTTGPFPPRLSACRTAFHRAAGLYG